MSKKRPKGNYKVGYCRPPAEHQFQPGQSGNQGRKRKTSSPQSLLNVVDDVLWKPRKMMIDGKPQRRSYAEIMVEQVAQSAAKGDRKAFAQLVKLAREAEAIRQSTPPSEEEGEARVQFTLKIGDPEVIRRALEAQRNKEDPG